jgi:hypothetical protein
MAQRAVARKRGEGDPWRCAAGFILAIVVSLPPCIYFSNKFQVVRPETYGRDTSLVKSSFQSWASSFQVEPTGEAKPIMASNTIQLIESVSCFILILEFLHLKVRHIITCGQQLSNYNYSESSDLYLFSCCLISHTECCSSATVKSGSLDIT